MLTTCATDYITLAQRASGGRGDRAWRPGAALPRVARTRARASSRSWSTRVFTATHSLGDELSWLDAEGPTSPALIDYIRQHADAYDFFIFFSFRYYHSFHGAAGGAREGDSRPHRRTGRRARAGACSSRCSAACARSMYNSYEERALIHAVSGNQDVPGVVVGIGSDIPERARRGPVPPEVRHPRSLRHLRRPHRREQGLQGAVRVLRAVLVGAGRRRPPGADRHAGDPDSRSTRASTISASSPTRTSSTRSRRPSC